MAHRILLIGSFLYLTLANLIWIARDTRPPFWDMAVHQSAAIRILSALRSQGWEAILEIPGISGLYPPFYHLIVAGFYSIFGIATDAAQFANLPATAIILAATYGIGKRLLNPLGAAVAATLVGFYPMILWLSRETLIDYWLTAMVALAMWTLIESDSFKKTSLSAAFGVICGLGMLTKGTFALFLALPLLWFSRNSWKSALLPISVALLISAFWYLPQAETLPELLRINNAGGVLEGDPPRLSWQAFVFYVRALEGYQLFLPLFVLFACSLVWLSRNFRQEWWPIILWVAGGWLGLMLFLNKDPRYSLPLLPAIALISAGIFQSRKIACILLIPLLLFQHYLVSFGVRSMPEAIVLAKGVDGPISWHWNLYTQKHFGLWGPPAREDWKISHVLERIRPPNGQEEVRLGIIPDIPRFDFHAFQYYATAQKERVVVQRIAYFDTALIESNEFILMSESPQQSPGAHQPEITKINQYVVDHPNQFEVVEWFSLPNGEIIRLYRTRDPA